MSCKSVNDPEDCLGGRNRVCHEAQSTHRLCIVLIPNRSPKLRGELAHVDDCRHVPNEKNHVCRRRDQVTTVTMMELMAKLTHAAAITGMPPVPIP